MNARTRRPRHPRRLSRATSTPTLDGSAVPVGTTVTNVPDTEITVATMSIENARAAIPAHMQRFSERYDQSLANRPPVYNWASDPCELTPDARVPNGQIVQGMQRDAQ